MLNTHNYCFFLNHTSLFLYMNKLINTQKVYAVYCAAELAHDIHAGHTDNQGNSYFTSCLCSMAAQADTWQTMVAAFLFDAAEYSHKAAKDIMVAWKTLCDQYRTRPQDYTHIISAYADTIGITPDEKNAAITKEEFLTLFFTLFTLNPATTASHEEYLQRFAGNSPAIQVKLMHLSYCLHSLPPSSPLHARLQAEQNLLATLLTQAPAIENMLAKYVNNMAR